MNKATSVEEYIASFPVEIRPLLNQVRNSIQKCSNELDESISYGMPAYKYKGKPAVYFAGYKGHIGFYATPNGHQAFAAQFAKYKQGKGSVQFPLNEPMPLDLIEEVVLFRLNNIDSKK